MFFLYPYIKKVKWGGGGGGEGVGLIQEWCLFEWASSFGEATY